MPRRYRLPPGFHIVSGGQTGADRAGLDWAIAHGIAHGGWCPQGRRAEDGPIDPRYLLRETPSCEYRQRTEWNVRDSDATAIFTFAGSLSGGSKLTAVFADQYRKPWLHLCDHDEPHRLADFLEYHSQRQPVLTLNIAGGRDPALGPLVVRVLDQALALPGADAG